MRVVVFAGALLCLGAVLPRQSPFDAATTAFGRAWREGNADAIAAMLAPDGIRLVLGSESHSQVAGRQARAAMAAFRSARAQGSVDLEQAREMGGDPPKGSAEFRWQTVVQGTSEPVVYTIFVELTRLAPGWRITEIRVF